MFHNVFKESGLLSRRQSDCSQWKCWTPTRVAWTRIFYRPAKCVQWIHTYLFEAGRVAQEFVSKDTFHNHKDAYEVLHNLCSCCRKWLFLEIALFAPVRLMSINQQTLPCMVALRQWTEYFAYQAAKEQSPDSPLSKCLYSGNCCQG